MNILYEYITEGGTLLSFDGWDHKEPEFVLFVECYNVLLRNLYCFVLDNGTVWLIRYATKKLDFNDTIYLISIAARFRYKLSSRSPRIETA
ncbi:hypothetical protein QVD17_19019 [Tagetes erecta]|uniref:Uncharacterized protein n=1 Tax=Tagetes erecta TaxID=13708 RepID=A0AAD8KLT4_TARER|nr:hypothetical protein QVD17_19019 [Tagetes erecta]